jgi:hypothetical protein
MGTQINCGDHSNRRYTEKKFRQNNLPVVAESTRVKAIQEGTNVRHIHSLSIKDDDQPYPQTTPNSSCNLRDFISDVSTTKAAGVAYSNFLPVFGNPA